LTQCSLRWHPCQHRAALTPRGKYRTKLGRRLPTLSSHSNSNASDSVLLPSFDPSHKAASLQGGSHSPNGRTRRTAPLWLLNRSPGHGSLSVLTPTSCRPSRVLSIHARTQRTRAPAVACLAEHPPHPPCSARIGFQGPRIPKRLPYLHQPSSLSCLSPLMRRYALRVQSLAPVLHEPSGPGASPPSYSPTPHELHNFVQPSGPPPSSLAQVACVLSERLRRVG
jgi:hypothetical protein